MHKTLTFIKLLIPHNLKRILLVSLFGITLSSFTIFGENLIDFHHLFGRCSANNSYCSACSNCNYCKNCSQNGGSCAVCYTPRSVVRKPVRKRAPESSSSGYSYRSSTIYKAPKPAQRIKSSLSTGAPSSQISTSSLTVDLAEQPVSSPVAVQEIVDPVNDDQASLNDTLTNFDYAVEIPLDAEFVRVNVPIANLRTTATTKSPLKQRVRYGELLIKLETSGDWLKVQTLDSGLIGYVFADLVQ